MRKQAVITLSAVLATTASAFFASPPSNPAARQATCTLAITWDPAEPETVELHYTDHRIGGPIERCGATERLAALATLRELIRAR